MKTSAAQFATLLHDSSLDSEQQQYVIDLLPNLTSKQIEQIAKILKKDIKKKRQIERQAQLQEDKVLHEMEVQLMKELKKVKQEKENDHNDETK